MFKPGLFTPTEEKIMSMLADGMAHNRDELLMLVDDQATYNNLHIHISRIRKKIAPYGRLVICEIRNRTINYRQVRHIRPNDDRETYQEFQMDEVS